MSASRDFRDSMSTEARIYDQRPHGEAQATSKNMLLFVGLEIGGTNLKADVIDGETGEALGACRIEAIPKKKTERDPQAVIKRLVDLGEGVLGALGLTWRDTKGIGVACPGQIARDTGVVVGCSTFAGWHDVPLAEMITEITGLQTTVVNDASAAASAEFAGRGQDESIAVLTLGTGVGLGVVSGGRIVTGSRGLIEGGHMVVEPGPYGRMCACGQRGCLEAYASGTAVAAIARERFAKKMAERSRSKPPPIAVTLESSDDVPPTPTGEEIRATVRGCCAVKERIRALERRLSSDRPLRAAPLSPASSIRKGGTAPASPATPGTPLGKVFGDRKGRAAPGSPGSDVSSLCPESRTSLSATSSVRDSVWSLIDGEYDENMTAADVFAMAKAGNDIAGCVVREACDYLGLACVNICRMVDPDAIYLTGGMSQAEGIVDLVREAFASRGWSILPHECEINLATACSPGSAGVVGAAGAAAADYARKSRRAYRRNRSGNSVVEAGIVEASVQGTDSQTSSAQDTIKKSTSLRNLNNQATSESENSEIGELRIRVVGSREANTIALACDDIGQERRDRMSSRWRRTTEIITSVPGGDNCTLLTSGQDREREDFHKYIIGGLVGATMMAVVVVGASVLRGRSDSRTSSI